MGGDISGALFVCANFTGRKIPYMLVVGDKEAAAEAVSVCLRTNVDLKLMPLGEFVERVSGLIGVKSWEAWE